MSAACAHHQRAKCLESIKWRRLKKWRRRLAYGWLVAWLKFAKMKRRMSHHGASCARGIKCLRLACMWHRHLANTASIVPVIAARGAGYESPVTEKALISNGGQGVPGTAEIARHEAIVAAVAALFSQARVNRR